MRVPKIKLNGGIFKRCYNSGTIKFAKINIITVINLFILIILGVRYDLRGNLSVFHH